MTTVQELRDMLADFPDDTYVVVASLCQWKFYSPFIGLVPGTIGQQNDSGNVGFTVLSAQHQKEKRLPAVFLLGLT